MSDFLHHFDKVDVRQYPDVHLLADDLDVVLWVLLVASEQLGEHAMSASEIADVTTLRFRRPLSRQRAAAILNGGRGLVARSGRSAPARFMLMKAGSDRVRGKQAEVMIIDPATAFTSLQRVEQLLAALTGHVLLCDPYVDDKTLIALTAIPRASQIKLLSMNVSDPGSFRRKLQAYDKEYGNLELRTSATPDLHDRYMLDSTQMWLIGQSLNGIGKKQSFIIAAGQDVRAAMEPAFLKRWNAASVWK